MSILGGWLIPVAQHTDVALPMNLDQVDVVNDPNLTGKPMEELTECCEDNPTLRVLLHEYLVIISSVSH